MTGMEYKHSSMSLTEEEVLALPTVLIQLRSDASLNEPGTDGLVSSSGNLDPANPNDLLIAMPASHYMEYNSKTKKYVPRLYFTEGSGGVLGANFMQGHDVLFDWEHQKVGFARSDCDYASIPTNGGIVESPDADCSFLEEADFIRDICSAVSDCEAISESDRDGSLNDGQEEWGRVIGTQPRGDGKRYGSARGLGAKRVAKDGVFVALETASPNKMLRGSLRSATLLTPHLTFPSRRSCEEVSSALAAQVPGHEHLSCDDSKCYERRTCRCSCTKQGEKREGSPTCAELKAPEADDSADELCQDLWGSCHLKESYGECTQLRVQSAYNVNDGNCYKVGNETRACNIQVRGGLGSGEASALVVLITVC